mmetsp:Transcript_80840/g.228824  ORF Transcript_80840/g.228824 Transcript_80840/m.228824 type:complete len:223 (+) Transcript_80840:970-1638(+)
MNRHVVLPVASPLGMQSGGPQTGGLLHSAPHPLTAQGCAHDHTLRGCSRVKVGHGWEQAAALHPGAAALAALGPRQPAAGLAMLRRRPHTPRRPSVTWLAARRHRPQRPRATASGPRAGPGASAPGDGARPRAARPPRRRRRAAAPAPARGSARAGAPRRGAPAPGRTPTCRRACRPLRACRGTRPSAGPGKAWPAGRGPRRGQRSAGGSGGAPWPRRLAAA